MSSSLSTKSNTCNKTVAVAADNSSVMTDAHLEVLLDSRWSHTLRNGNDIPLNEPSKNDLENIKTLTYHTKLDRYSMVT